MSTTTEIQEGDTVQFKAQEAEVEQVYANDRVGIRFPTNTCHDSGYREVSIEKVEKLQSANKNQNAERLT